MSDSATLHRPKRFIRKNPQVNDAATNFTGATRLNSFGESAGSKNAASSANGLDR